MDLEREHSSLPSIQSTPTAERQLGQMNLKHSPQVYDSRVVWKMNLPRHLQDVYQSNADNRPKLSGYSLVESPYTYDEYPGVPYQSNADSRPKVSGSSSVGNPYIMPSRPQLADEESARPASPCNARTAAPYIAAEPFQNDDQSNDEPTYQHMRMLGHGGSASVEQVLDLTTGSVFARKIIRNVYSRNVEEAKRKLLNEIRIMQRLPHHHIVRVHSTRIEGRELTMILDPAADGGDLAGYLQNYRDQGFHLRGEVNKKNIDQNFTLRRAFGCLSSALDFIHSQTIRHKDIKPQNILIHQGKVMYTDFGLSYDYGDIGQSTTTGNPQGITKRYCAPEVAEWERRNTKSDVFSLGCVFIEILLALANDAYYDGIYGPTFQETVQSYKDPLPLPWTIFEDNDGRLLNDVVQKMMRIDPTSRPSAHDVADTIIKTFSSSNYCSICAIAFRAELRGQVSTMVIELIDCSKFM